MNVLKDIKGVNPSLHVAVTCNVADSESPVDLSLGGKPEMVSSESEYHWLLWNTKDEIL